jgi:hypothetical protein
MAFYAEHPGLFQNYDIMKKLTQKHGKEITKGEVKSGVVYPAMEVTSGNASYSEYRFDAKAKTRLKVVLVEMPDDTPKTQGK